MEIRSKDSLDHSRRSRLRLPSSGSVRCFGLALCVHWPGRALPSTLSTGQAARERDLRHALKIICKYRNRMSGFSSESLLQSTPC
jgi:hypothetical protein